MSIVRKVNINNVFKVILKIENASKTRSEEPKSFHTSGLTTLDKNVSNGKSDLEAEFCVVSKIKSPCLKYVVQTFD